MSNPVQEAVVLREARDEFVTQWGAIGSCWGVNRTMAQIHALLLTAPAALTTDQVMEELRISRGNANGNLRELAGWGLIRSVIRKGERKEYFEAEKDVWKIMCIVSRERKRREIEPARAVLQACAARTKGLKLAEARAFHRQIEDLGELMALFDGVLNKVSRAEQSQVIPWMMRFLK
jgi:DNA-binding transcriptional regulator GbsR (MarR family)